MLVNANPKDFGRIIIANERTHKILNYCKGELNDKMNISNLMTKEIS